MVSDERRPTEPRSRSERRSRRPLVWVELLPPHMVLLTKVLPTVSSLCMVSEMLTMRPSRLVCVCPLNFNQPLTHLLIITQEVTSTPELLETPLSLTLPASVACLVLLDRPVMLLVES